MALPKRRPTLKTNEPGIENHSRWVLYHGTSTRRLHGIFKENLLLTSKAGDPTIALTTERSVAEYFACSAVFGDRHDYPNEESSGVVLALDGEELLARNCDLTEFSDPVWGEDECDWENEMGRNCRIG
jgi:hypothetical protein